MTDPLSAGGFKVDRPSQKMLLALNEHDSLRGSSLRNTAELSQNAQVFYRMENHLIPAGLVDEHDRRHEQDQRRFSLTEQGTAWLEAHEGEVELPKSRLETQGMAHEALEQASSAKDSVQHYRGKVHRLKKKVEDQGDSLSSLEERMDSTESTAVRNNDWVISLRDRKADESDVEQLEERVDAITKQQRESVNRFDGRLTEQGEEIAALREENQQLRSVVAELREEMDRGVIDRAQDRWANSFKE